MSRYTSVRILAVLLLGPAVCAVAASTPAGATSGSTWTIVPSPDPTPSQHNALDAVSCTGTSACTAVGNSVKGTVTSQLVESWTGSAWSIVASANPPGSIFATLSGVSCTSGTACTAVGTYDTGSLTQTLVETSSGSNWSVVPSPDPPGSLFSVLTGVSCTGPTACTAVGYSILGTATQTLVEAWDGSTWSVVQSPDPAGSPDSELNGVSCTTPSACTAVGYAVIGTSHDTLVESWDGGSWTIVPSPGAPGSTIDDLLGVSCTGATSCAAVGYSTSGSSIGTLVELWNGSSWSVSPSPDVTNALDDYLYGVSCTGPIACTAVGYTVNGGTTRTLIEAWDGSTWSIVPSPTPSNSLANVLSAVSCTGPVGCTAVGSGDGSAQTLVFATVATGYREVASDGGLFSFGAPFYGSMGGQHLNLPIVGMAIDPVTGGYWEVAADGGLFSFGAPFYGSMGGQHLNAPIVGIAADPVTGGYWEVAADGGIFGFDAPFYGSMGGQHLNRPIVGISATTDGLGYREVAADGGLFSFGAPFYGSMGGKPLNAPIVGIATDPSTGGYWEVAADGGIFGFDAPFYGSMGGQHLNAPIVGIAMDGVAGGYWEVAADGGIFNFEARFLGSMGDSPLNDPIVGLS